MNNKPRQKRRLYLLTEIWGFLRVRKKWWLLPIIVMLLLVGILIIFAETSPMSPFIYSLI